MMPVKEKIGHRFVRIPAHNNRGVQDVKVNWREIDSSNVERIGWDNAGNMYVRFAGGGTYAYIGVSRQRAVAAAHAKSTGSYLHHRVIPDFSCVRL